MNWQSDIRGFKAYLQLERSMSANTVAAYLEDIGKLASFFSSNLLPKSPTQLTLDDLRNFLVFLNELGLQASSQSRIISGIKAFYRYLLLEGLLSESPAELLEMPRTHRKMPEVLHIEEINQMIEALDLSKPEGHRNKAILECLYSCGLRVSELVELRLSGLYFEIGFIRVKGKGDKERLVPIGKAAQNSIQLYVDGYRRHLKIAKGDEDFLFLSRNGRRLTRMLVFLLVKQQAAVIGLTKVISPHSFRHAFATHMVEAGADLRAVQEMLGHESITTTEIYTHLSRDYLRDVVRQFHPRH
ncbi:MAG: tyrosine recombinase [Bacteroidia bacterium]